MHELRGVSFVLTTPLYLYVSYLYFILFHIKNHPPATLKDFPFVIGL